MTGVLDKDRSMPQHKVFISFHHGNDQYYKEELLRLNRQFNMFIDASVDTGGIPEYFDDQKTRQIIRDQYLRDSTVTILLVGTETKRRKHVDWEIYSSMIDGTVNKKSGILVINLPTINGDYFNVSHSHEKERLYPDCTSWTSIDTIVEYEKRYPYMPDRIIDNLLKSEAKISVVNWDLIARNPHHLAFLINATFDDRSNCQYALSREMRRNNS